MGVLAGFGADTEAGTQDRLIEPVLKALGDPEDRMRREVAGNKPLDLAAGQKFPQSGDQYDIPYPCSRFRRRSMSSP